MAESDENRLDRELIELLNELRVALPGVQVLFAFLLTVPFSSRWEQVTDLQRDVFFAAFLCAAAASMLLIAPSTYHRLRWRRRDKERMLQIGNRLAIGGTVFLSLGMSLVVFLIGDVLFGVRTAAIVAGCGAAAFGWLWFGLPLVRLARD